ncbi:hypothetical protein Y032_0211g2165 [Ancylostoma ceylanicum]|uniref:Uncharacterized protein n=1 Tax=Ancylostoma ceylanicum TaxID=53326 RepID=A0A016SKV1_9BILA|nr:hypothetical protein Y032_0211g2165 [Ancylostoma ceylanicum]
MASREETSHVPVGRRRGRGQASRQKHIDEFRHCKNAPVMEPSMNAVKERLGVFRFQDLDKQVKNLRSSVVPARKILPITTRAIAFASASVYNKIFYSDLKFHIIFTFWKEREFDSRMNRESVRYKLADSIHDFEFSFPEEARFEEADLVKSRIRRVWETAKEAETSTTLQQKWERLAKHIRAPLLNDRLDEEHSKHFIQDLQIDRQF